MRTEHLPAIKELYFLPAIKSEVSLNRKCEISTPASTETHPEQWDKLQFMSFLITLLTDIAQQHQVGSLQAAH